VQAAAELFADRGFDRATARDIAQRADVDPTMIARYFGGKTQLFIEVLRRADSSEASVDISSPTSLKALFQQTATFGPGPIFQAGLRLRQRRFQLVCCRSHRKSKIQTDRDPKREMSDPSPQKNPDTSDPGCASML
jgi:AcrR family transcriptional regulator